MTEPARPPIKPLLLSDLHTYSHNHYRSNIRIKRYSTLTKHHNQPSLFFPKQLKSPLISSSKSLTKTLKISLQGEKLPAKPLYKFLQSHSSLETLYITFVTAPTPSSWRDLLFILKKLTHLKALHIHTPIHKSHFDMTSGLSKKFRKHPRLADFTLTDPGNSLCPLTLDLDKVGISCDSGFLSARFISRVRRFISLTPRFSRLKTIRINTGKGLFISENVLLGLDMAVTRLLHLEKISMNSGESVFVVYKELNKILDSINKSKTLKHLKMGFLIKTAPKEGFPLDHEVWTGHPERTLDLTIGFSNEIDQGILKRTLQGIRNARNLVGLCLDLRRCKSIQSGSVEKICEMLGELKGLKKLKVRFDEFNEIYMSDVEKVLRVIFEGKRLEKVEFIFADFKGQAGESLKKVKGLPLLKNLKVSGGGLSQEFCEEMMRIIRESSKLEKLEVDFRRKMNMNQERFLNEMRDWSEKLKNLRDLKMTVNKKWERKGLSNEKEKEEKVFMTELASVLSGFRSLRKAEMDCFSTPDYANYYLQGKVCEAFRRSKVCAEINSVKYNME